MKKSKAQQIIDLRKAGNSKATICSLIKSVSPSEIGRALAFLAYHGEYELLRHPTFVDFNLNYTNADYKAMAELSLKNGWSKEATALIFKASRKIVARAISAREQSDMPLTTHEVQLPEFVSVCGEYDPLHMVYDEERIAKNNEAIMQKAKGKKQQNSNLLPNGYYLSNSSYINQKLIEPTAPTFPERFGRATAPVVPPKRKKINRSVEQMKQKRQQELIEEHNKNAAAYINGTVEVVDTSNPNKYEDVFSLSHPVRKNKASAEEILEQAGKPSKGRPRIVDIHSKDFDKLPADIQNKHLLFAQKEEEIKNIVRPLIMDSLPMHKVTKSELIAIKVSVVDEVIEEYPDFKLFSILEAAALYYDTYRAYKTRPRKSRDDPYRDVKLLILDIAKEHNYTYGRYRMTAELRNHNVYLCHITVRRLMKELELTVVPEGTRTKYDSYQAGIDRLAPNLIKRDFSADEPLRKLFGDVTEFKLSRDVKIYLSAYIDGFNNEVVTYSVGLRPSTEMVLSGLQKIEHLIGADCIIHTDQGCQYQSSEYHAFMNNNPHLIQSMSRKGNCFDNALIESFFDKIKTEMFYKRKFKSVNELIAAIRDYIYYYNNLRAQFKNDWMAPTQYRLSQAA